MTFRPFPFASLIPSTDDGYSLGSPTRRWADGYFGHNSVHIISTAAETTTATDWQIKLASDGYLGFAEGSSTYATLSRVGHFGVGVANPVEKIHTDGYVKANQGFKFGDGTYMTTAASGSGSGVINNSVAGYIGYYSDTTTISGDSDFTWDATNNVLVAGTVLTADNQASSNKVTIAGGTLATTKQVIRVTGTLSSSTGVEVGSLISITSPTTAIDGSYLRALDVYLNAGYTGSARTYGLYLENNVAGTGLTPIADGYGNIGGYTAALATTAGHNIGSLGIGSNSTGNNYGAVGRSTASTGTAIGLYGTATSSSGVRIGAAGTLYGTTDTIGTLTSAALYADNAATTSPIFIARDGGTTVFTIADNGDSTLAPVSGHAGTSLTITSGTLASTFSTIVATGTLSTTAVAQTGYSLTSTGAGSGSGQRINFTSALAAGYTGSANTLGGQFTNASAGTGVTPLSANPGPGNMGFHASSASSTAGHNVGIQSYAASSTARNIGIVGRADSTSGSPDTIGVYGTAISTAGTPKLIGGMFSLYGLTDTIGTLTSSALIVDNAAQAVPILLARDNGTTTFTIADGGDVTVAPVSGHAGDALLITAGTLASTKYALSITATLPNVAAGQAGANLSIVAPTGSSATFASGSQVLLSGSYSGNFSYGFYAGNSIASQTGTTWSGPTAAAGITGDATGAQSGNVLGVFGRTTSGTGTGIGVFGRSSSTTGTTTIGVAGQAETSGTVTNRIGGYFTIRASAGLSPTTLGSAALMADNSSSTSDILVLKDDTTTVLSVADGGILTVAPGGTTVLTVDATTADRLRIAAGTLASTKYAINLTATLPNTAAAQYGTRFIITSPTGSSATVCVGMENSISGSYSGSFSYGLVGVNSIATQTGTTWGGPEGTTGVLGEATGANAGNTFGVFGRTTAATGTGIGVFGRSSNGSTATSALGVTGQAPSTTGTITNRVGGYFTVRDFSTAIPTTLGSAALVADNSNSTLNILTLKDDTTSVMTLADGGVLTVAPGGTTTFTINTTTNDRATITGASLASTKSALVVTGTLSATSATQTGALYTITSTGTTGTPTQQGISVSLAAGYTQAGASIGLNSDNSAAGTGTDPITSTTGNFGISSSATGATAGWNIGAIGRASASTATNIGEIGLAIVTTTGSNVGSLGRAVNATGTRTGGHFSIGSATPTFVSAALLADNQATTDPIFLARDNASTVFSIADGGAISQDGGAVFNSASANVDFRVSGDVDTNLLSLNADGYTNGTFGIGVPPASQAAKLHIDNGSIAVDILRLDDNGINVLSVLDGGNITVAGGTLSGISRAVNVQTGTSYTLVAEDNFKVVTLDNAASITLTVPAGLPTGFNVKLIQLGAGQVTVATSGTTVNNRQSHTKIAGQYGVVDIMSYAANTYTLSGDTSA